MLSDAGTPRINEEDDKSEEEETVRPASAEPADSNMNDSLNKENENETEEANYKSESNNDEEKSETEGESGAESSSKLAVGSGIGATILAAGGTVIATSKKKGFKHYNFATIKILTVNVKKGLDSFYMIIRSKEDAWASEERSVQTVPNFPPE